MEESLNNKRIDVLLGSFIDGFDIKRGSEYVNMHRGWRMLVGIDIAAHTRLVNLEHGTLIVEADHPAWMNELYLRRDKVLADVRRRFPELNIRVLQMILARDRHKSK